MRSEPGSWYLQAELELFVCHAEVCSSNILLLPGMLLGSARGYVSRLALTYLVLGLVQLKNWTMPVRAVIQHLL